MKEIIPGLPEPIRPHFWGELIPHISLLPPKYDDEVGFVWDPWIYTGPYYEDLPSVTFDQIIAGISGEIYVILNSNISREEQESYLKAIENHEVYQDIHSTRKRFEKEVSLKYDFASEDPEIPNLREHVRLMVTIEGLIEKAYVSIHTRAPFMSDNDDTSETIKGVNVSEVDTLMVSANKTIKLTTAEIAFLCYYDRGKYAIEEKAMKEVEKHFGHTGSGKSHKTYSSEVQHYAFRVVSTKDDEYGDSNLKNRDRLKKLKKNLERIRNVIPYLKTENGKKIAEEEKNTIIKSLENIYW